MIASSEIRLLDDSDATWIAAVLDVVERSLGEPWRVMLERIEHTPVRAHRSRVRAVVGALRRVTGSRADRRRIARKARALVLGHPALDRDARDARLAAAGCQLGVAPAELESLLWADLAMERPVTLPTGRPRAATLAAIANLDRIQRAVRRAREVRICVWGDANDLVRTVARYGLLARITRDRGPDSPTILEVTGPLALFHLTTVYGRALAALIPLLAEYARFTLEVHCDFEGRQQVLRVEPPILLPAASVPRRRAPSIAERLASALADAGYEVEREPSPLTSGDRLLFPDLATEHAGTRWLIEIVPFCTAEYLASKLASYRDAGIDCSPGGDRVVLCIDSARASVSLSRNTLPFARRVEVAELEKVFAMEIVS